MVAETLRLVKSSRFVETFNESACFSLLVDIREVQTVPISSGVSTGWGLVSSREVRECVNFLGRSIIFGICGSFSEFSTKVEVANFPQCYWIRFDNENALALPSINFNTVPLLEFRVFSLCIGICNSIGAGGPMSPRR